MDYFVNLLIGDSSSLDVYVLIRLLVLALLLEFFTGLVSGLRGGRR